jgi:hypothetical protein
MPALGNASGDPRLDRFQGASPLNAPLHHQHEHRRTRDVGQGCGRGLRQLPRDRFSMSTGSILSAGVKPNTLAKK